MKQNVWLWLCCILFSFSLVSCDISGVINQVDEEKDEVIRDINRAIDQLNQSSTNWESIALNLINELEGSGVNLAEVVSAEIQTILDQANATVANAGVEFRCNSDFVGKRLEERLIQFRDAIQFGREPTPISPWVCHLFPNEIRLNIINGGVVPRDPTITIYGFNFTNSGLPTAQIINPNGSVISSVPVGFNTPYQLSVNVQGANLSNVRQGARIKLRWPTAASEYQQSDIFLIMPPPTIIPTRTPRPTAVPIRNVCLKGSMTLHDDEIFDDEEKSFTVNKCARIQTGHSHTFNIDNCAGGEVRLKIRAVVDLRLNASADADIDVDFYEGTSCTTTDLADSADFILSAPPNGTGPKWDKKFTNGEFAGGDWAKVNLTLSVSP